MSLEEENSKNSRPLVTSQTSFRVLGEWLVRVQLCMNKGKRRKINLLNSKYLELKSSFEKW